MSELLQHFFSLMTPAQVTEAFILLMLVLTVLAMVFRLFRRAPDFVEHAPGVMTSLGILGTFFGIIIGLFDFSLEDIDNSIAVLMDGLKTAFITSVVGLSLSLFIRVITRMIHIPGQHRPSPVGINDLNDNLVGLRTELQENLDTLARTASASMVGELEKIVARFNERLEQQFGDNLTRFSDRLESLLPALDELAQEYRDHGKRVDEWDQLCGQQLASLAEEQEKLLALHDKLAELPHLGAGLTGLLDRQREQLEQTNSLLVAQQAASHALAEMAPEIQPRLENLARQLASSQSEIAENIDRSHQLIAAQSSQVNEHFQKLSNLFERLSLLDPDRLQQLVEESAGSHRTAMRELAQMMAGTHREMLDALTQIIRTDLQNTDIALRHQYENIDRKVSEELDMVFTGMGEALATISGQFTRDYRQLVAQMQRIVEMRPERDVEHAS
ncbi:MotA/TolQ/ExbB proton channel family protein [Microbulbifer sediminum]|uniref:MotA/TolQ/ExbB proton channel family protein n=1 Tax=Microbulbifer sediminum TaxID=2904250 RepID=UPI001F33D57D|nr:MotA/TolQ/ExbB proton channel family protein [Microbulbifer sediminum]